jgi:superfamily I DNA/RNA helicase
MHRSKGLEFAAVALPFLSEGSFPPKGMLQAAVDAADLREMFEREKSLLHVAATRAKKLLRVSWNGTPSSIVER